MKFQIIVMKIQAETSVEVEADSLEEAKSLACQAVLKNQENHWVNPNVHFQARERGK